MVGDSQGMLKYSSFFIRASRSVAYLVPLIFGWVEEAQEIRVVFSSRLTSCTGLQSLIVQVFPRELQVYKAELELTVELTGVRRLMAKYFYLSMIICIAALFVINSSVLACAFCYYFSSARPSPRHSRRTQSELPRVYKKEEDLQLQSEGLRIETDFCLPMKPKRCRLLKS
jgi:hypothetical protein